MADTPHKFPAKTETSSVPSRSGDWLPFEGLRREIDRLFDDFHPFGSRGAFSRALRGFEQHGQHHAAWPVAPAMDLVEKKREYEINAELPGIDENDVEIKVSDHRLTIKGEKSEDKEEKKKDYFLSERRYGSFQRSFQLPDGIDTDKIEASFSKGVLRVKLPKTVESQSAEKTISVKPE